MTEQNPTETEKSTKIVKPDRVDRILSRVCNARLEILVRSVRNKNIAVRGKAAGLFRTETPAFFLISDLSEQGARFLRNVSDVQVEFIGMSTQIVFTTKVIEVFATTIKLAVPTELISYDRRANARYSINEKLTSFMKFSFWEVAEQDLCAPPVIDLYRNLANWVPIADVSEGGICCTTRYPSLPDMINRGAIDPNAQLILPMHPPITLPVEIRWTRRIKESKEMPEGVRHQRFFRLGIQFIDPSEENAMIIKQYIHQLSVAEAI